LGSRFARLALVSISFCFALALVVQFAERGTSVDLRDAVYYYGIPALLSAAALSAAFLRPAARALVSIYILAAGAGLIAAEIYVGLTAKPPEEAQRQQLISEWAKAGIPYDSRSVLEVVRDMRRENIEAYPPFSAMSVLRSEGGSSEGSALSADGGELLPLGTVSNTPTVVCNETGKHLIYRSDRYGFHNPADVWERRRMDLAALGDSYTEGYCVPSDRNFVALVREKHPATLNLGIQGNGPLLELAGLTEYLVHVRPRSVLWFYYEGNDLVDLEVERRNPLLTSYLRDGFTQNLMARQPSVDKAIREYFADGAARRSAERPAQLDVEDVLFLRNLRDRLRLALTGSLALDFDEEASLALLRDVLAAARSRVEGWDGTLVFVYLPSVWTHLPEADQPRQSRLRERVLQMARAAGVPVIDVSADFLAHPDPASLFVSADREAHYNERGYRLVAEKLLARLPRVVPGADSGGRPTPSSKDEGRGHAGQRGRRASAGTLPSGRSGARLTAAFRSAR
jgi:lysophospholipase L1-like esterase